MLGLDFCDLLDHVRRVIDARVFGLWEASSGRLKGDLNVRPKRETNLTWNLSTTSAAEILLLYAAKSIGGGGVA